MVACASVQVATEDNPKTGGEHSVLAREDLAKDTSTDGAQDTSKLENGGQPTGGAGGADDGREVVLEARHDERLAEHTLLVSIFKTTEAVSPELARSWAYEEKLCGLVTPNDLQEDERRLTMRTER